jgi:hypothetical protein
MYGTMKNFAASTQLLRKAAVIGVSASVLLLLATSAHADDLVTNGSFELTTNGGGQLGFNTDATGWSVPAPNGSYDFLFPSGSADTTGVTGEYGALSIWGPNNGSANGLPASSPDGGNFVALDGDFQVGALSQTITGLTAGDVYAVSFWWAASQQSGFTGPTIQSLDVSLGSETIDTSSYNLPSEGFSGWMYQTDVFTADSSSDVLSFLAVGNVQLPPFILLDGVSMTPTPEPGTLPLLFTGLMGGLGVLRSRKWLKR